MLPDDLSFISSPTSSALYSPERGKFIKDRLYEDWHMKARCNLPLWFDNDEISMI
jgi:hypothetical protein